MGKYNIPFVDDTGEGLAVRKRAVLLAFMMLLTYSGAVVQSGQIGEHVLAGPQAEVPTWLIGDWWDYELGGGVDAMGALLSATGNIRFEVTEIMTQTIMSTVYHLYNVSISGSFTGSGSGTIQGIPFTATVTSATLGGFWWIERGDLAVIVDNETLAASGDVTTPLGTFPLTLNAEIQNSYNPSREDFDFPMEVGDQWDLTTGMTTTGYVYYFVDVPLFPIEDTIPLDNYSTLLGTSTCSQQTVINVPAGSFESYDATMGLSDERWFSETVGYMTKWESHGGFMMFGDIWMNLTSYDRAVPAMVVEEYLVPNRVSPGANVTVNGTGNPLSSVHILIPATGDSWMSMTDIAGIYSFNITAPVIPDNTPTPTDFASHGVVVEVIDGGTRGYSVKTLTLIIPDLYVTNISFDPTPSHGFPTDVSAEIHCGPDVGVMNEFLVIFEVDGQLLGSDNVPYVDVGSPVILTHVWNARIGLHEVTVTVDPLDAIPEQNETNNSLTVQVYVEGPDIAPSDVLIENGISYLFPTGEPFGHVSNVMNVPTGSFVSITTNVTNFGLPYPIGNTSVRIVETAGLRGLEILPPLLETMPHPALGQGESAGPFNTIWNVPIVEGMYYFNITVDPYHNLTEMNEDNNTFVLQFNAVQLFPDLYITPQDISFSGQPYFGNPTTIYADVHANTNISVTGPFDVSFFSDGQLIGNDTIASIAAGATVNTSVLWIPDVGTHTITVVVDPLDFVGESDETNNSAEVNIDVPWPDLSPRDISVLDGGSHFYLDPEPMGYMSDIITTYIGQTVDISVNVTNFGAPFFNTDFRVEFYNTTGFGGPQSQPAFYDSGFLSSLAAGQSHGFLFSTWNAPSPAGNYFINITVDVDSAIPEISETNNTFILRFEVLAPDEVDYIPSTTLVSPIRTSVNKVVNLTSKVENLGISAASSPATIAFYEQSNPGTLLHTDTILPLLAGETSADTYGFDWTPAGAGTYVIVIVVDYYNDIPETNELNNEVSITVEVYEVPVTTLLIGLPKYSTDPTYVTSSTVFTLTFVDYSGSGLAHVNYRIGSGQWNDYLVTGNFTVPDEGPTTIEYYSEDNIGGTENPHSISIYVDDTPPESTLSHTGEVVRPSSDFMINATDDGSGVAASYYTIDGRNETQYFIPFNLQVGTYTILYYSVDNLGNEETPKTLDVTIEGHPDVGEEAEFNYKPILSVVFAVILLILGLIFCRRVVEAEEEDEKVGYFRGFDKKSFIMFSLSFAIIEVVIGAVSAVTGALSIPPTLGAGLIVDLAVLIIGLIIAFFWNRKEKARLTPAD